MMISSTISKILVAHLLLLVEKLFKIVYDLEPSGTPTHKVLSGSGLGKTSCMEIIQWLSREVCFSDKFMSDHNPYQEIHNQPLPDRVAYLLLLVSQQRFHFR